MRPADDESPWDLSPAIDLLHVLSLSRESDARPGETALSHPHDDLGRFQVEYIPCNLLAASQPSRWTESSSSDESTSLGDFGKIWDFLGKSRYSEPAEPTVVPPGDSKSHNITHELDSGSLGKYVRWRDELESADLEDSVESDPRDTRGSLRTHKRAARRARVKHRAEKLAARPAESTGTDAESGEELSRLRRSPDRRAIIQDVLQRARPGAPDGVSPPTSPSPPKSGLQIRGPISTSFLWPVAGASSSSHQPRIEPLEVLSSEARKKHLITCLAREHPEESIYLSNTSLVDPAFAPLNLSVPGIHVFVDISNIMIGFHDCLKIARSLPLATRIRRVPMCFHSFSLVLERGRPAAKRVLVGSDKSPVIQQAKETGYEANILERVHKAKELTPRQKRFRLGGANSGLSSGSETTPANGPEKWVEQAVDEILHLKILESLIDAAKPATIVLATGDAAEAEYSGGFMRMVERALEKGWMVELVSFRLNTSGAYKRKEFRSKWGPNFKWVQLDSYVEQLIGVEA